MDYKEKLGYVGNPQQLFPYKEYRLCGGRQEGVYAVDVATTAGLDITVVPDRAMDIYQIRLNGKNLNFISPVGICAPQYYNSANSEFLRNFFGGFLSTCGLSSIGAPSTSPTGTWGLHGRIANTPAERLNLSLTLEDGLPTLTMQGEMHEAVQFAEHFTLHRQYRFQLGKNKVEMRDLVTNTGFAPAGHMVLYHFNMGYPLLDENLQIYLPSTRVAPRDEWAARGLENRDKVTPPAAGYAERCYYHTLPPNQTGMAGYGCFNPSSKLGMFIEYSADTLDHFIQWNMFGKGDYALGLETANGNVDSRAKAEANGTLKMLAPGQSVAYTHTLHFFDNEEEFGSFKARYPRP
ncbi:MAG: aldose 1-epimerase family protein [Oscillospiraceae bacterium]